MALSDMVNNLNMQAANDWVNQQKQKKDEEEWAKQKEEERRVERVKEKSSSKKVSGAAKQVQQAVTQTTAQPAQQKSTGLQKIETPASSSSLSYNGTSSNFSESQQRAAEQARQAEAERKAAEEQAAREAAAAKAAQEQAAREAAAREAERQRQEQLAARQAEKQRQREIAAAQAAQEQAAKEAAAQLSYNGAGASPRTRELEAQWGISKESEPETTSKPRRSGEYRAEAQTPVVYTPQSTTTAMTTAARTTAANTKAALTGEESGLSEEQLAWLQTPEGQAALANQQAKAANDTAIRNAALNTGITFQGQPILQDKRISREPIGNTGIGNVPASTLQGLRGGTPPTLSSNPDDRWTIAYNLAYQEAIRDGSNGADARSFAADFADRTVQAAGNESERTITFSGQPVPESTFLTGQDRIDNEQLVYEQGTANYLRNNGAQADSNGTVPIVEWFRKGQAENNVYDQAYQEAYNQVIAAGGSYNQADAVGQNAGDMAVRNYRAQQPKTETSVSEGTTLYDEIVSAGNSRRSGENRAEANAPTGSGQAAGKQGPQFRYNPRNNSSEQSGNESASRNGSVKMTTSGGVSGGQSNNSRPGVDAALQEIMEKANAAGLTFGGANQPGATGNTVSGKPTKVQTGNENGIISGTGTKGSSGKEGVSNSEKTKGKNVYFRPSYGQAMDKGVKLPYKAGGYTAKEIEAAGNKARSDEKYYNGAKAYEGYYLAPDGKYYPIDMEKAAYYKANHNSYKGWEEPMREYYQTFGTYYGYRPDWKTAGGKNTWKANNKVWENYRPAKNSGGSNSYSSNNLSYSPASSSASTSGRSYGRGSTANNGMYWNGNTSWSI